MISNLIAFLSRHYARYITAKGVSYSTTSTLDIYKKALQSKEPLPVVIFWHGGSWQNGNKELYRFLADGLVRHGDCIVVVPDYAHYPQQKFPGFIDEAWQAVSWVREHIHKYGGDKDRLAIMGHSAGAHTASMLAVGYRKPGNVPPVMRFIGVSGPYVHIDNYWQFIFGESLKNKKALPITHAINLNNGHSLKTMLIHGRTDTIVKPEQTRSFALTLQSKGVHTETRYSNNVGHFLILALIGSPLARWSRTAKHIADFIK